MFYVRRCTAMVLTLLVLLVIGPRAHAGTIPFTAWFHGWVVDSATDPTNPNIELVTVQLQDYALNIGDFTETVYHRINTVDNSFTGTAIFDFGNGNTFQTVFWGQLYPTSDPDWLTFNVTHVIIGGTGALSNASGTFHEVDGNFNYVTGEDLGGYEGKIKI